MTTLGLAMIVKGDVDLGPALDSCPYDALAVCVDARRGNGVLEQLLGVAAIDMTPFTMWTPTCIHMAENRNRSLDLCAKAGAGWIFALDADETVEGPLREAVEDAVSRGCNGLRTTLISYQGGRPIRTDMQIRAHRTGAMRYRYPIHNLTEWLEPRTLHDAPEVTVHAHYPEDPTARHGRAWPALVKLWQLGEGWDVRFPVQDEQVRKEERRHAAYHLAKISHQRGRVSNMAKWARRCTRLGAENGYRPALRWYAEATGSAHGIGAGISAAIEAINRAPAFADPWLSLVKYAVVGFVEAGGDGEKARGVSELLDLGLEFGRTT